MIIDPSKTSLLIHPNATIVDSSNNNVAISNSGASVSGSQSKFSQYPQSVSFNGSSYFSVPTAIGATGSNNFFFSMWVYPTSLATSPKTVMAQTTSTPDGNHEWTLSIYTTGVLNYNHYNGVNNISISSSAGSILINNWYLVAISRSGNTFNTYINGAVAATGSYSGSCGFSGPLTYGVSLGDSGRYFTGYMAEMMVYTDAYHSAAYTPENSPFSFPGMMTPRSGWWGDV